MQSKREARAPVTDPDQVPVLIVGAGPAGLTAAAELARHGIEALMVERRPALFDHPRATAISTSSMELLRSWGLEDDVRAGELEIEWRGWACQSLSSTEGAEIPLGLPTREQSAAVSPTAPACVPQDHLEPVLLEHAVSLGARTRFGTELVGLDSRPDGVEAVLHDEARGLRTVRARYAIGADGAYSAVRGALRIPMHGPGVMVDAVAALFYAPLWRLLGERRYGIYPITHPEARGVMVPAGRGDRWIYGVTGEPGKLVEPEFDHAAMTRLIRLASGAPGLEPRIARIGSFAYTARLADRFGDGTTFLAGDAAHRVTPRGGTGMNTAIHDGFDLGWKLAWVLRGWADRVLLDSYEPERRPVAEHNVLRSADPDGSVRDAVDELHVDLGGRIPHLWIGTGPDRRSTLDLLGPGLTRFTGPEDPGDDAYEDAASPWLYRSAPVTVARLPAITARALGIGARGSLLVRPDGVPAQVTADTLSLTA
jgi:2-polyprenyl-6-methoxyphenol hydroxylase-like FAD-dependent oxidoreductase